ncbi:cupin-like domain-containing protein [Massilia sp. 9096]|uniref:cupin-like domain-containing protein n=1 Tax=Massilia sp. 9096 TaxID=1500894 RepID=UPI000564979C|nr:cupin-like domain-containing protein [Massilia sp. 9096]
MTAALDRLPPLPAIPGTADDALARNGVREARDAQVRGVVSMAAMRDAIKDAARALPSMSDVGRVRVPDGAAFRARAAAGLPFVMTGVLKRWPLSRLTVAGMRERCGDAPVRARVGDYIGTAFAPDRAMRDMALRDYLDLVAAPADGLPPYVGNLELRPLNALCHWPGYFERMGPPRYWLGPAGTITPLHCDYDDNVFAQVWGSKRIMLAPPHHEPYLYVREANPVLFGSPVDAEAPDFDRYPLARQATLIEVVVQPGEMLYVPAGWYHQVHALEFSLSVNRWARGVPLALGEAAGIRV